MGEFIMISSSSLFSELFYKDQAGYMEGESKHEAIFDFNTQ
jgi:hypothetical protein